MQTLFFNEQKNSATGLPLTPENFKAQLQVPDATTQLKCPVCKKLTEHFYLYLVTYNKLGIHSRKALYVCVDCGNNKLSTVKD